MNMNMVVRENTILGCDYRVISMQSNTQCARYQSSGKLSFYTFLRAYILEVV